MGEYAVIICLLRELKPRDPSAPVRLDYIVFGSWFQYFISDYEYITFYWETLGVVILPLECDISDCDLQNFCEQANNAQKCLILLKQWLNEFSAWLSHFCEIT